MSCYSCLVLYLPPCCNIIRPSWESKKKTLSYRKKYIEEFVWASGVRGMRDTTILVKGLPSYFIFCRFFRLPSSFSSTLILRKKIASENGGGELTPTSVSTALLKGCNFILKKFWHRHFPVKFAKFLKTPIFKNICKQSEQLVLNFIKKETPTQVFSN